MLRNGSIFTWFRVGVLALLLLPTFHRGPAHASEARVELRVVLTSNIQGRSTPSQEGQDAQDPLLLLAQNIVAERKAGADLYLDLGNAFYPGVISKFSSGSVMMDFLDQFGCSATLVSSKDLQVGIGNLEFLQKNRRVRLLSANIRRPQGSVFTPYFVADLHGVQVAFVGVSSSRLAFDIAEKDLYTVSLQEEKAALQPVMKEIAAAGIKYTVLLSGLKIESVIQLLAAYPQIGLALCGGDDTGALYAGKAARIDLADGRSILLMDERFDYAVLELALQEGAIHPVSMLPRKAAPAPTSDPAYLAFAERLYLWKSKYLADQSQPLTGAGTLQGLLDDEHLLELLRDRFNSEVAVVDRNTLNSRPATPGFKASDLLGLVNLDYNVFTFAISGSELKALDANHPSLVLAGLTHGKALMVQGYPVEDQRRYKVAATQPALEKLERLLGRTIPFQNSWATVSSVLREDLQGPRVALRQDYTYLENRFRSLIDVYASNFVASGDVDRKGEVDTPVDQPAESYSRWGLEDRIDWILYNQHHRFILTPYLFYLQQDHEYVQNLLRGTLVYEYNLNETLRPYDKFQVDTAVKRVNGQRPVFIRETAGLSSYFTYLSGRLGVGFEKRVQDPSEDALFGLEGIASFKYPFLKYFTYRLDLDNFASIRNSGSSWGLRSQIDNTLSIRINDYLGLSIKHRYYYLHENEEDADYRSSQIFTTLDLKTDWKIW